MAQRVVSTGVRGRGPWNPHLCHSCQQNNMEPKKPYTAPLVMVDLVIENPSAPPPPKKKKKFCAHDYYVLMTGGQLREQITLTIERSKLIKFVYDCNACYISDPQLVGIGSRKIAESAVTLGQCHPLMSFSNMAKPSCLSEFKSAYSMYNAYTHYFGLTVERSCRG